MIFRIGKSYFSRAVGAVREPALQFWGKEDSPRISLDNSSNDEYIEIKAQKPNLPLLLTLSA